MYVCVNIVQGVMVTLRMAVLVSLLVRFVFFKEKTNTGKTDWLPHSARPHFYKSMIIAGVAQSSYMKEDTQTAGCRHNQFYNKQGISSGCSMWVGLTEGSCMASDIISSALFIETADSWNYSRSLDTPSMIIAILILPIDSKNPYISGKIPYCTPQPTGDPQLEQNICHQ